MTNLRSFLRGGLAALALLACAAAARAEEAVVIVENYSTLPATDIDLCWGENGTTVSRRLSRYIEGFPFRIVNNVAVRNPHAPTPHQEFVIPDARTAGPAPTCFLRFRAPTVGLPGAPVYTRESLPFLPPARATGRAIRITLLDGIPGWYGSWTRNDTVPTPIPMIVIVGWSIPRPTISWVGPKYVTTGTIVTVSGTNFRPWAGAAIEVRVGGRRIPALLEAGTNTIRFAVPVGLAGGPVTVVTPGGTVTSGQSLIPLTAGGAY